MTQKQAEFPFPGIATTTDGSGAAVWAESLASTGAGAYPITPSTNMGVGYQAVVADGKKNAWGQPLAFVEPESEHSAASACEGYALAGGRVTNFTASQGLILMKEVLYTIAGKRLPMVFHIGARALTHHSLNVHAGHDDVMGVVDCGWGMLFARNAQEVADLALIARKTAEDTYIPFFDIQDGFLTTHTVENVSLPEADLVKQYLQHPDELRNLLDPMNPITSGSVQNQDAYMKGKVAQRAFYAPLKETLKKNMKEYSELTGRNYDLVIPYMMDDAEYAIVGMASMMETAHAMVKYLREEKGVKVGAVSVTSYRPFPGEELINLLKNCKVISVLERMDECSAPENPLARDIKAASADAMHGINGMPKIDSFPVVQHGAGGLGSRDIRAQDFIAIVENMKKGVEGKLRYTVGVPFEDNLDFEGVEPDIRPAKSFSMRGHSVGGYGSVTTNKIIASICGELFDKKVQAYPKYGAEKKGLPTTFYLTIGNEHIDLHQELNIVEFVPVNDINAFHNGNPLAGLHEGGILYLQTSQTTPEGIWGEIPAKYHAAIKEKNIRVFGLDSVAIAKDVSSSADLVQRMQGIVLLGIFLKATPFAADRGMDADQLMEGVEKVIRKYFGKRGEQVVQDNLTCVKRGYNEIIEVPREIM